MDAVFVGKERACNRRFQQMCSHYPVDPPSIGLEPMAPRWTALHPRLGLGLRRCGATGSSPPAQGQVENQVGTMRERLFSPRVRVKSMAELDDRLLDQCVARAKVQPHPEIGGKMIWEVFEAERASLVPYRGPFAPEARSCLRTFGATASTPRRRATIVLEPMANKVALSKICLVRFDNNKYSVEASAVGRPVEVRAPACLLGADRIELRQDGRVVGEHAVVHWA